MYDDMRGGMNLHKRSLHKEVYCVETKSTKCDNETMLWTAQILKEFGIDHELQVAAKPKDFESPVKEEGLRY